MAVKLRLQMPADMYVWDGVQEELAKYLNSLPDGTDVDLSGCRFGTSAVLEIKNNQSRLNFINTTDEALNVLLEHNKSILASKGYEVSYFDVSFDEGYRVADYLQNVRKTLSKDIVLTHKPGIFKTKYAEQSAAVGLACLLFLYKRKVMLVNNDTGCMTSVMNVVNKVFTYEDYLLSDHIHVLMGNGQFLRLKWNQSEETLYIPGLYTKDLSEVIRAGAIPGWVGEEAPKDPVRKAVLGKALALCLYEDQIPELKGQRTMKGLITEVLS